MKELLEKYPKTAKVVKDFYMNKMLKTLEDKGLPDDFKAHVKEQGIQDDMIVRVMEEGPRNLFDVLDENEIYIDIDVHIHMSLGTNTMIFWSFDIPGTERQEEGNEFYKRIDAEKAAIEKAFEILEQKL